MYLNKTVANPVFTLRFMFAQLDVCAGGWHSLLVLVGTGKCGYRSNLHYNMRWRPVTNSHILYLLFMKICTLYDVIAYHDVITHHCV